MERFFLILYSTELVLWLWWNFISLLSFPREQILKLSWHKQNSITYCNFYFPFISDPTRKQLKFGSLPTENMPEKSHTNAKTPRRTLTREISCSIENQPTKSSNYGNFIDVVRFANKIMLKGWTLTVNDDRVIFENDRESFAIPYITVVIDDSLGFSMSVFGWYLPATHHIYKENLRSVRHITVSSLLQSCEKFKVCPGYKGNEGQFVQHIVPKKVDPLAKEDDDGEKPEIRFNKIEFRRHIDCDLLGLGESCMNCKSLETLSTKLMNQKKKRLQTPAKTKAPVSKTTPERLKLTLQDQRLKCSQLESELEMLRTELKEKSIPVSDELESDIIKIMSENGQKVTPFMKLFWDEQKRLASVHPTQRRFHPMIIRYCLSVVEGSAVAYDKWRRNTFLILPSSRVLTDYRNAIHP